VEERVRGTERIRTRKAWSEAWEGNTGVWGLEEGGTPLKRKAGTGGKSWGNCSV